jgi:hypothetical protein
MKKRKTKSSPAQRAALEAARKAGPMRIEVRDGREFKVFVIPAKPRSSR